MTMRNQITHVLTVALVAMGIAGLTVGPAGAGPIAITNADFNFQADGVTPPAHNGTVIHGWNQSGVAGAERTDTGSGPAGDTDPEIYFYAGASIDQDLSHNWSPSDTFTLGIIGHNPTWGATGEFSVQLRQASDDTVLWDSGNVDVSGTVAGGAYTGTGHIHSWTIDASTFIAGTEGEQINIRIAVGAVIYPYLDDVTLAVVDPPATPGTLIYGK